MFKMDIARIESCVSQEWLLHCLEILPIMKETFCFPVFNAHNDETLAAIHGGNE
jgi:hypothetical protein